LCLIQNYVRKETINLKTAIVGIVNQSEEKLKEYLDEQF
jgi:hypothetical protein